MKNVLVLGAGLVARPLLHDLLRHYEHRVLVGTLDLPRAKALMGDHPRGTVCQLDAADSAAASPLVAEADLVVSLLPHDLNPAVARLALAHRKPMVTTSYASEEMLALDGEAKAKGVLLLNEMGLDPGIDHMSAAATVRQIRSSGGKVARFLSCCGGFPALDANTNPWGYKFSWSPQAVVSAGIQPARFLRKGQTVEIPGGGEVFDHSWPFEVEGLGVFEVYPNRDSLKYIPRYGLSGVRGMFRGTLRYPGWCATMRAVRMLGLFDTQAREWPSKTTYSQVSLRLVPQRAGHHLEPAASYLGVDPDSEVMARLEWAGLFSDRPIGVRRAAPIEIFLQRLQRLMMYQPGERDLVALQHLLTVGYPDGSREEIRSTLVRTGEAWGDSAMAKTVSLPAAIAARLILRGGIMAQGVQVPVLREIYEPVLDELREQGIGMEENRYKIFPGPLGP